MTTVGKVHASGNPYRNVYIFLALLIPAVLLAFAASYFKGLTFSGKSVTVLIHMHTALMMLWVFMLIAQAWFIRTKRFRLHRWVGRSSYVIAPVVIVTALVTDHELLNRAPEGISVEEARIDVFAWGQMLAFGVSWGLAILYRKRTPLHVRFMISTAFAIGTAMVFRLLLNWTPLEDFNHVAAANWSVLSLLLFALIAMDWRWGMKLSPFWVVTVLIGIMHIGYWTFTRTEGWLAFCRWYADLPLWLMFDSPFK